MVSTDTAAILDPHKRYIGTDTRGWDNTLEEFLEFTGHAACFANLGSCSIRSGMTSYPATIFRFPLRQPNAKSEISSNSYSVDRVRDFLFQSFIEEAPIILLFLKHVEEITFYDGNEQLYKVCIHPSQKRILQHERDALINLGLSNPSYPTLRLYSMSLGVDNYCSGEKESYNYHWLVCNMIGSSINEVQDMSRKLQILPWVGIAVPLPEKLDISEVELSNFNIGRIADMLQTLEGKVRRNVISLPWCNRVQGHIEGRAFCFLPLPNHTCLPVNIHGYFGVSDNRRSIEWPASDNRSDKAMWNRELILKHVAPLYSVLICCRSKLISYTDTLLPAIGKGNMTDPYAAWPLSSKVKHKEIWSELVKPTVSGCLDSNNSIFWSLIGRWVSLHEAVFLPRKPDFPLPPIAIEILINARIPVVNLPDKVWQTLEDCQLKRHTENVVTPSHVRISMRNTRHLFHTFEELRPLLECIFHDINRQNSMELNGLDIIPLATELFKVKTLMASSNEHDVIYLLEKRMICVVDFLPGVESTLISKSLVDISNIYNMFYNLAKWEIFQIRLLDPKILCLKLLPLSIKSWTTFKPHTPISWKPQKTGNPPIKWIEDLWNWLCSNPEVLGYTVGLPILPKEVVEDDGSSYTLLPFPSSNDKYYFKDDDEEEGIASLLTKLGATVLEKNKFVFCHSRISHHVLQASIPQALPYLAKRVPLVNGLSRSDREYLCSCIARYYYRKRIPSEYVQMLRMLSIYKVGVGGTSKNTVSLENSNLILPPLKMVFEHSLQYSSDILDNTDRDVFHLLSENLKQHVCNSDEVYLATLQFAITQCSGSSSWNNGDKLIMWVINENPNPSQQLIDYLSHQAFVRTEANSKCLKKPCELYNPCDEQFCKLFNRNEDEVFPKCDYLKNNGLSVLIRLGLKSWTNLSHNPQALGELLRQSAESVSRLSSVEAFERSFYILELIGMFHKYSNELMCFVKSVKFLCVEESRPERFLSILPWYGEKFKYELESPSNLCYDPANANLVGSIRPMISSKYRKEMNIQLSCTVIENFLVPSIEDVLQQLKVLIKEVQNNQNFDRDLVSMMVDKIYSYFELNADSFNHFSLPKNWIWWEDQQKFMPSDVFVQSSPFDLTPFIFSVQSSNLLLKHKNVFQRSGIKQSPSHADLVGVLHKLSRFPHTPLKESFIDMSVSILQFLKLNKYHSTGEIFLPTTDLKLCPVKECTYDDREWVRKKVESSMKSMSFVHENVPASLAEYFAVEPLSRKVAPSTKLPFNYKQIGQKESLTRRIRGIVNDYSGNIDVFKELIQNADDAKATELKLLLDWRQHGQESLFEENMKYWQGPALVAYNNATFSDQDFNNICEIAGETKMSDPLKTGRFGVGFCSCYSLTDVPSFISRQMLTIFDPHTKYLGNRVSHNEPGMQINIVKEKEGMKIYEDQVAPFNGLFGCNLFELRDDGFNGTIFRFPLRMEGAPFSEITNDQYDSGYMQTLIENLQNEAQKLLLFLKHVQCLEVFKLERNAKNPKEMKLLFKVFKMATNNSERVDIIHNYITNPSIDHAPVCSSCTISVDIPSSVKSIPDKHYILASAIDTVLSSKTKGVIPLAELAVERTKEGFPVPHDDGQLFCFLPLPVKHSSPFYVNSYFDVGKNRRGLREAHDSPEYMWNKALIEKVLPIAFEFFLHTLTTLVNLSSQDDSYKKQFLKGYYALWPGNTTDKGWVCELFSARVKELLTRSEKCLLWSDVNGGEWSSLANSCLFECFPKESISYEILQDSIKMLISNSFKMVECPSHVFKICRNAVEKRGNLFNYKRFFIEVFIPEIESLENEERRDRHLIFVLKKIYEEKLLHSSEKVFYWAIDALKNNRCIPVTGSSSVVCPCDLVDVDCSPISCLYNSTDGCFPKENFRNAFCTSALIYLGMITDQLPIDQLAERASTINTMNKDEAYERMINILKYIAYIEHKEGAHTHFLSYSTSLQLCRKNRIDALSSIKFLMAQPNPSIPFIPWYNLDRTFFSPSELFDPKHMGLIFNQRPIFLPPSLPEKEKEMEQFMVYLGIENHKPLLEDVIENLCCLIDAIMGKEIVDSSCDFLDENFTHMYKFLNRKCVSGDKEKIKTRIGGRPCVWQNGRLHYSQQILLHWDRKPCYPYICPMSDKNKAFDDLFTELGVRKEANWEFLCEVLMRMNQDYEEKPIPEDCLEFVCDVAKKLYQLKKITKEKVKGLVLPDEDMILRPTEKLCCDSNLKVEWISQLDAYEDFKKNGGHFIHSQIPREVALKLGAYPIIDAVLRDIEDENFLSELEFGQYEDLVDRLNGILKKYPADETIFKEFIQNADDAKAKEIVFILDQKSDYPNQLLVSETEEWKQLQKTPALCIFNNKPFKEEDIENICKLGRGGKGETSDTIGRFGIGFNIAYHLTDCPSFVSFDKNGNPENFCVFDPLRKYCPKFNWRRPGRRWKSGKDTLEQFSDQFLPFLREKFEEMNSITPCFNDLTEGFTMFRLPLVHFRPKTCSSRDLPMTSKRHFKEAKIDHPSDVKHCIEKLKEEADNMILFLNHLESISVFEINDNGNVVHHFSTISKIDRTLKEVHTPTAAYSISYELTLLHVSSMRETRKETRSKWLKNKIFLLQPLQYFDQTLLDAATDRGLEPNGDTALQLGYNNVPFDGLLFYFLPMNISSCLPMHFNAHFLVDDSRSHLDKKLLNLEKWNESIAQHVLVPSYVQLILEARRYVDGSKESIKWFYSHFPILKSLSQQSEASTLNICRLFYEALLNNNDSVLLDDRGISEGNINWLSINNGDIGHFCASFYRSSPYITMNETVSKALRSLKMPITCAPEVIFVSLCEASFEYAESQIGLVTPHKVIDYLKSTSFSEEQIDTLKKRCEAILKFCLQNFTGTQLKSYLSGAPILLTLANTLDTSGSLFESVYSTLLPHLPEKFIHTDLEHSSIRKKLREGGCIECLPIHIVAQEVQLSDTSEPVELQAEKRDLVRLFWIYINHHLNTSSDVISTYINNKPLIPSSNGSFYPPCLSKCVFESSTMDPGISSAIKKLGYPTVDFGQINIYTVPTSIAPLLSKFTNAQDIISCMQLCPPKYDVEFTPNEVSRLISVLSLSTEIPPEISEVLKHLPLFETVDGSYLRLSEAKKFYVMPANIPHDGLFKIQQTTKKLILKVSGVQIEQFYSKIIDEVTYSSAQPSNIQLYINLIVPHLECLNKSELLAHLMVIRSWLLIYSNQYSSDKEKRELVELLQDKPFINKDGKQYRASDLYDPEISFHRTFNKTKLPPEEWTGEWLPFLRILGLRREVDNNTWLSKARKVAEESRNLTSQNLPQDLVDKSDSLLISLKDKMTEVTELDAFLTSASTVQFIYCKDAYQLETELEVIAGNNFPKRFQSFVCFHDAVLSQGEDLACLCQTVLPPSCDFINYLNPGVKQALSVRQLSLKTVISNLNSLSTILCCANVQALVPSVKKMNAIRKVKNVFEKHYSYLDKYCGDKPVMFKELETKRSILLSPDELSFQLVKPSQLVCHLPSDFVLDPFCFQVPSVLFKYGKLLNILEVKEEVDATMCIEILYNIKVEMTKAGKNLVDDDHFMNVCKSAYNALISFLRKQPHTIIPKNMTIVLPSDEFQLLECNTLVCNDVPWIQERLQKSNTSLLKFLYPPPPDQKGQKIPPPCLRVKLLSSLAKEELHEEILDRLNKCKHQELFESKQKLNNCEMIEVLSDTFKSEQFSMGFERLYWHEHHADPRRDRSFCKKLRAITKMQLNCVRDIKTVIVYDGKEVSGTEDTTYLCYLKEEADTLKLYVVHQPHSLEFFLEQLSANLNKYLEHCLRNETPIKAMLRCYSHEIEDTLNKLQISPFDLKQLESSNNKMDIGSEISITDLYKNKENLLIMCNFKEGEKVIYHSLIDGESSFNVAQIVKCPLKTEIGVRDKHVQINIAMDKDAPEVISTSLLQVHKILDTSQYQMLCCEDRTEFSKPLVLAFLAENEDVLNEWITQIIHYNELHPVCSVTHLSQRLLAHMHHLFVKRSQNEAIFIKAAKHILQLVESTSQCISTRAEQEIIFFVRSLKMPSLKDDSIFGEPVEYIVDQDSSASTVTGSFTPHSASSSLFYPYQSQPHSASISTTAYTASTYQSQPTRLRFSFLTSSSQPASLRIQKPLQNIPQRPTYNRDSVKAKAWLQQAKADYMAACDIFSRIIKEKKGLEESAKKHGKASSATSDECKYPALVCFLGHDVVEKCIKGVMYAKCGLPDYLLECSNLTTLSNQVQNLPKELLDLIKLHASLIAVHGNRSRYPNYHHPPCAPACVYSFTEAIETVKSINELMNRLLLDDDVKMGLGDLTTLNTGDLITTSLRYLRSEEGKLILSIYKYIIVSDTIMI